MRVPVVFLELSAASNSRLARAFLKPSAMLMMSWWQLVQPYNQDKFNQHAGEIAQQIAAQPPGCRSLMLNSAFSGSLQPKAAEEFGLPVPDADGGKARGMWNPASVTFETVRLNTLARYLAKLGVTDLNIYMDVGELSPDAAAFKNSVRTALINSGLGTRCVKGSIIDADAVVPLPGNKDANDAVPKLDTRPDAKTSCPWLGLWIGGQAATKTTPEERQFAAFVGSVNRMRLFSADWAARGSNRQMLPGWVLWPQQYDRPDTLNGIWTTRAWEWIRYHLIGQCLRTAICNYHLYNEAGFVSDWQGSPNKMPLFGESGYEQARAIGEEAVAAAIAEHCPWMPETPLNLPQMDPGSTRVETGSFVSSFDDFVAVAR